MNISLAEKEKTVEAASWPQNIDTFTPLMKQYLEIKYKLDSDVLLFFRVGDFYETFFEDAKITARELELTLTGRAESNYQNGKVPMAGVPAKAIINYVSKLLQKGFKVAICEQMEDPALAKGIVKREVTKLLTPGTLLETDWLPQTKNNYIAAICKDKKKNLYGFAYADVSCGELFLSELNFDQLISELSRIMPSEIIVPVRIEKTENQAVKEKVLDIDPSIKDNWFCTGIESEYFKEEYARKKIKEELKIISTQSIDVSGISQGMLASGAIFAYIDKTQILKKATFQKITPYNINSFLNLDKITRKNLELTETTKDRAYEGSLLWAVDFTKTQMGKRRLRTWIEQPLINISEINLRLDAVEELTVNKPIFSNLSISLEKIHDLERISSRLSASSVNAKELVAMKDSLIEALKLSQILKDFQNKYFQKVINYPAEIKEVIKIIESAVVDDPSAIITEGNLIKPSFNSEVRQLKEIIENGDSFLSSFETIERERSGIKNLKVGFNRTFGYFIEISKGNLPLVPREYICKQTMVNSSRFITQELKDFEQKALHADQKIKSLEYELFCQVREQIKTYTTLLREYAYNIANLDAIFSLAQAAIINNYKRPILNNKNIIQIQASRHPVVEKRVGFNNFISNDCFLETGDKNNSKQQLMILTGPNMAGKSTYMRQIALNVILAQAGSFIPCDYAEIGITDQIFTRVGASDDISEGQSTFMVEMIETSAILNRMTEKSLILLDEVGRGTSTYDGVAIAWALAEYLVKNKMPRTIFATHFHELNGLADLYNSIRNYQVTVKEEEGHVIFLRKVIPGGADKSYGIEVAKMAGLPKELLKRARDIMDSMYNKSQETTQVVQKKESIKSKIESGQLRLFDL